MDQVAAVPGKAVGYQRERGSADFTVADWPWADVGPGGIQTTPSELVRWADNYRTGQVGGQALLQAQLADPAPVDAEGDRYAAGIAIDSKGNGRWAGFYMGMEHTMGGEDVAARHVVAAVPQLPAWAACVRSAPPSVSPSPHP